MDSKIPGLLASEREKLPVDGEALYPLEDLAVYRFTTNNGARKISINNVDNIDLMIMIC